MPLEPEMTGNRRAHRVFVIDDEDAGLSIAERQGHVGALR
jgi:hypothetical protein